ncbi:hypothetical protein [Thioalkalivibrio sp.]|uniref:hypothetical protein n=1 Tax=Thioalkalivibrio sp. TaxID=2093813 RepID=UPI0039749551
MQTEHEKTLEENDMEMGRKYWLTSAVVAGLFLVTGCSDPGPAEEAGEQVDETVDETGEAAEETAQQAEDAIDPPGPAERAGRKIDEAVEGTREKIDEMTDN